MHKRGIGERMKDPGAEKIRIKINLKESSFYNSQFYVYSAKSPQKDVIENPPYFDSSENRLTILSNCFMGPNSKKKVVECLKCLILGKFCSSY